jgi:hypothetical protein
MPNGGYHTCIQKYHIPTRPRDRLTSHSVVDFVGFLPPEVVQTFCYQLNKIHSDGYLN